jgi:membrane associated rhomboid family serine protease
MNPKAVEIGFELASGFLAARRKPSIQLPLLAVSGVAALIGVVFLAMAGNLALAERFPPPIAAAITGATLIVIALMIAAVALGRHRTARRIPAEPLPIAALTELADKVFGQFEGAVGASPKSAALAAFAVGCVLGCNPGLQHRLRDLVP